MRWCWKRTTTSRCCRIAPRRPWSLKQRILGRHGHLSNEAAADAAEQIMSADLRHLVSRPFEPRMQPPRTGASRRQRAPAEDRGQPRAARTHLPGPSLPDLEPMSGSLSRRRSSRFDLPELQPYRTMRRQHEHREQGIFVAEGEKVVRRLLESKFSVVSVLLPEKWLRELDPLLAGAAGGDSGVRRREGPAGDAHRLLDVSGPARGGKGPAPADVGGNCRAQSAAAAPGGGGWPLQRRESRGAGPQLRGLQRPGA